MDAATPGTESATAASSTTNSALVSSAAGTSLTAPNDPRQPVNITFNTTDVDDSSSGSNVGLVDSVETPTDVATAEDDTDGSDPAPADANDPDPPAVAPTQPPVQLSVSMPVTSGQPAQGTQAEPGFVAYENTAAATSSAVQQTDKGVVRFLTVINGPSAPQQFRYVFGLPANTFLKVLSDGAVVLLPVGADDAATPETPPLVVIDRPWAVDASGKLLPASYSINSAELTLTVSHAGAVYPVTADPAAYTTYQFSPANPSLTIRNPTGELGMQVNYANWKHLTATWYFKLATRWQNEANRFGGKVTTNMHVRIFGRDTRYHYRTHVEPPNYVFHSSLTGSYTYADDRWFPRKHYLRAGIGMRFELFVLSTYPAVNSDTGRAGYRYIQNHLNTII
ncbi:MAG: hypothetical protein ACT4P1_16385 [Sporichthyaceae bacterium]